MQSDEDLFLKFVLVHSQTVPVLPSDSVAQEASWVRLNVSEQIHQQLTLRSCNLWMVGY